MRKRGSKNRPMSDEQLVARFKARCVITDRGCWEFTGSRNEWGYAQVSANGKVWMLHRLMYTIHKGPIAPGLDCLHECDNPPCCNPDHLWAGTQRENSLDMVSKGRTDAQKRTHCKRGHPYDDENTSRYGKNQWRDCKICARGRMRIRAGWPEELAFSMDRVPNGFTPVAATWKR